MPTRTQNVSHVLIKAVSCGRGQKMPRNMCWPNLAHANGHSNSISTCMYHNMCWPNPTHAREDSQCKQCFDQTHHIPARTQYASKHVLIKPIPCQRGHKIYLNMCWPNNSNVARTQHVSQQTDSMPARTQNISQLVLTKCIPCQLRNKKYLKMCYPNPSR